MIIGECNIFGIYVPWGLLMTLVSILITRILSYGLARVGFYRQIWHPALFDFALFIIVLGCIYALEPLSIGV